MDKTQTSHPVTSVDPNGCTLSGVQCKGDCAKTARPETENHGTIMLTLDSLFTILKQGTVGA